MTMLYLGLRPGEAAALSWADIDADHHIVHVRRALQTRPAAPSPSAPPRPPDPSAPSPHPPPSSTPSNVDDATNKPNRPATIADQNERPDGYDRDLFAYGDTVDDRGCRTRALVLIRDSLTPAQFDPVGCEQ